MSSISASLVKVNNLTVTSAEASGVTANTVTANTISSESINADVFNFQQVNLDLSGNLTVGGNLAINGTTIFSGGVTQEGLSTFETIEVTDAAMFNSSLDVSGNVTLRNATVSETLGVTGNTVLNTVNVRSNLDVSGNVTLRNVVASGTLGVTGATTLSSTLGVTGAMTLSSTLGVTGATTLGATTVRSNLDVSGNFNANTSINYKNSNLKISSKTSRDNASYTAIKTVSKNLDAEPYKLLDGTLFTAEVENLLLTSNINGRRTIDSKQALCLKTADSFASWFSIASNRTPSILISDKKFDSSVINVNFSPSNDCYYMKYFLVYVDAATTAKPTKIYLPFTNDIRYHAFSGWSSNSGVVFGSSDTNKYEIQIQDSYLAGASEDAGLMGSVYNNYMPLYIPSKPSATTENQLNNYVILYDPLKYTDTSGVTAPAVTSVFLNNVLVQYRAIPFSLSTWTYYQDVSTGPITNDVVRLQNHADGSNPAFTGLSVSECSTMSSSDARNLELLNIQKFGFTDPSGSVYRKTAPYSLNDNVYVPSNRTAPFFKCRQAQHTNRITFVDSSGVPDYSKYFPNDALLINGGVSNTVYGSYQLHYNNSSAYNLGSVSFGDGYVLQLTGEMAGYITKDGSGIAAPEFPIKLQKITDTYVSNDLNTLRLVYLPRGVSPPYYIENVDSVNAEVTVLYNDKVLHKYVRLPSDASYSSTITLNAVSGSLNTSNTWIRQIDNFGLEVENTPGDIVLEAANTPVDYSGPSGFNADFNNATGYLNLYQCIDVSGGLATGTLSTHDLPVGSTFKYLIKTGTCATIAQIMTSGTDFTGPSFSIDVSALNMSLQHRVYFIAVNGGNPISTPFYKEIGDTLNNYTYEYGTSMYANMFTFPLVSQLPPS